MTVHIFVGSTWLDLQPERKAVEAAIHRMRETRFTGMEYFGSRDETTRAASLVEVDRSDVYVGIFGGLYGSGITENEYRRARERKLPCFVYFKDEATITPELRETDPEKIARLAALKEDLKVHTVSTFSNPDDLAAKVTADLHRWLLDNAVSEPALHQLPQAPADFTGRKNELKKLRAEIKKGTKTGGVTISSLQGPGGVGKTALALKLAEDLKSQYSDAQFYLDLKGADAKPLSVADALSYVIQAFRPTMKLPKGEAALRGLYNSVLAGKRALVLMDNARDAAQVSPLIPPAGCMLLVTSRQHFTLPGLFAIDLNTLPDDDAQKLLLTIAPRIGKNALRVAKLCGFLPLALRLAASTLQQRTDLTVDDYLRRAEKSLKLFDDGKRLTDAVGIEASISTSYDLLSLDARSRWVMLSVFPSTFDRVAAAAVWAINEDAASDALGELRNYSLVEWDDATARYRLHDLTRLFADDRLEHNDRVSGQERHANHYKMVLQSANKLYLEGGLAITRALLLFDMEANNIEAGYSWAISNAETNENAARLCYDYANTGVYLMGLRLPAEKRIKQLEAVLVITRRLKMQREEGFVLANLGNAYHILGQFRRAIEFHEQSAGIARQMGDRRTEGNALGNLGNAYHMLGEFRRAIEFHEQNLVIAREIPDRRSEGNALGNLGNAYHMLTEFRRAIEFHEQNLVIVREIEDRRGEGNALGNLGNAYRMLGDFRRAIEFHEKNLAIAREIGDKQSEGNALGNLGAAYSLLGENSRAIEFHERNLVITREIGDRRGESAALWNMSLVLDMLSDRKQAIALAEESLKIKEEIEDMFAVSVRNKLAEWRREMIPE